MSQQINLFNPIFLKQKKVFSAANMVDALALLLVGVALFYGYASIESLNLDRQSVETARQYYQAKAQLTQTSARYAPKTPDASLAAQVKALEAQLSARKATLDSLGVGLLASGASYAEDLRALARQSLPGLWLTHFKVGAGGEDIEIVGRVLQPGLVPVYIQRLKQERALHGRAFDSLSMTQREAVLPADASGSTGVPASYRYTEFRLGSSYAEPAGEADAAVTAQSAPDVPRAAQIPGGESR
jgi:hypothetical protein